MHRRRPGQWPDSGFSLVAEHPSWFLIGQSEMDLEAGKASTGNGEIEQWRLLGPTMKHKCNCETFLILIETFPFQKTQQLIVQGKLHHNFSVQ